MTKRKKKILKKISLQLICYAVIFDSVNLVAMELEENLDHENKKNVIPKISSTKNDTLTFTEFLEQNTVPDKDNEKNGVKKQLVRRLSSIQKSSKNINQSSETKIINQTLETKSFEVSSLIFPSSEELQKNNPSSVDSQNSSPSSVSPEGLKRSSSSSVESQKSSPTSVSSELVQTDSSSSSRTKKEKRTSTSFISSDDVKRNSSSSKSEKSIMSNFPFLKTKKSENISSSLNFHPESDREEKNLETSPHSLAQEVNKWDESYIECAEYFFRKCKSPSEAGKILAYSAPLFISDYKCLFAGLIHLKQQYSLEITAFLEQLVLAAFPNGIKNLQSAETEFNELKKGLMIPPLLNLCFSNNFMPTDSIHEKVQTISDLIILNELHNFQLTDVNDFHVAKFMNGLLARDRYLFERISLKDIQKEKSQPESILTLVKHFNRTSFWVALNIVSSDTQEERKKRFKLFCFVGNLLLESKNFHGAMQIALGLQRQAVARLIPAEMLNDENWKAISSFLDQGKNFKNYRTKLSGLRGQGFLPVFTIISSDLIHAFEGYEPTRELQGRLGTLEAVAKTLETFLSHRDLPYPDIDPEYMKLLCGFRDIHDETLEVFSDLWKKWPTLKESDTEISVELTNWTPWYFASLLRRNGCSLQVSTIFKKGIHDGKDLIAYMGEGSLEEKEKNLVALYINANMINAILLTHDLYDHKK